MIEQKSTTKASISAISLLIIGSIVGVALDRAVMAHGHGAGQPGSVVVLDASQHQLILDDLIAHLQLSGDQRARVDEVFSAHQSSIDSAWTSVRVLLEGTIDEALVEVEAVLDSTQRTRLHEWLAVQHGEGAEARDP